MSGGSLHQRPVYNARIPFMLISRAAWTCCAVLFIFLPAMPARANEWQGPAGQLAHKIAAVTGPGAVAVTFANRSSLGGSDTDDIRRKLENELGAVGVQQVNPDQAAATVQVSLSEDLRGYLWIAEIHQGTNQPVVVMVPAPGRKVSGTEQPAMPVTIHKALLWTGENRILDVGVLNSNPVEMVVLEPERVALYRLQNNQWQQEQILPIAHSHPWPRDVRGRLMLRKDHLFDAYLPGVLCHSTAKAPLSLNCNASDDPWPLTGEATGLSAFFSANRNFFTGVFSPRLVTRTAPPPFYSAAAIPRSQYTLWILATVDGPIHFLDGVNDQALPTLAWGSDIASVRSTCGTGWQLLVSSTGTDGDTVSAFEVPDREPTMVSRPVDFSGRVSALWADADASSVTVVSQNSQTGKYEAYRLSNTCQ